MSSRTSKLTKMIITKVYCDICKQELAEHPHNIKIAFTRTGMSTEYEMRHSEVCEPCIVKIYNFIESIKNDEV